MEGNRHTTAPVWPLELSVRSFLNHDHPAQFAEARTTSRPVIRGSGGIVPTVGISPDNLVASQAGVGRVWSARAGRWARVFLGAIVVRLLLTGATINRDSG
jgi:hypothetical protein